MFQSYNSKQESRLMNTTLVFNLMVFYGVFLFLSAIAAFALIGPKAKTALMSGGMSGTISLVIAYCVHTGIKGFAIAGPMLCLLLFCVFAWRSYKTLIALVELIQLKEAVNAKAIAFMIISLMAVVSLVIAGILFSLILA